VKKNHSQSRPFTLRGKGYPEKEFLKVSGKRTSTQDGILNLEDQPFKSKIKAFKPRMESKDITFVHL